MYFDIFSVILVSRGRMVVQIWTLLNNEHGRKLVDTVYYLPIVRRDKGHDLCLGNFLQLCL